MKQKYKDLEFRKATLNLIAFMNTMITDYQRQGFTLSVRQLYYQLVARDKIPNTEQSYKRIASIINDARLAGLIDWDAIEDRNRDVVVRGRWDSAAQIIQAAASSYHMDMWEGQSTRVYVIVEKAALAGVLGGVCHQYDVPLLAARGYPSVSILREIVLQHFMPAMNIGQRPLILHLGDHDPSGIDMTRDLMERIDMFAEWGSPRPVIQRIALTMPQIEEKEPPPNPAKVTDSRFDEYSRKFGDESWELDALEPSYLVNLVTQHITNQIDEDLWKQREDEIDDIKARLQGTAEEYRAD